MGPVKHQLRVLGLAAVGLVSNRDPNLAASKSLETTLLLKIQIFRLFKWTKFNFEKYTQYHDHNSQILGWLALESFVEVILLMINFVIIKVPGYPFDAN